MGRADASARDDAASQAWGRRPKGGPRDAPGSPGADPHWAPAAKDGVGTAVTPSTYGTSLVWSTLGRGVLTEVFYSRMDCACTREMGLIVTDGRDFFSD